MMKTMNLSKSICLFIAAVMLFSVLCMPQPVYGASSVNKENIITEVRNPSNGVLKYKITVPPGEKVDYSVELTPDKKYKVPDVTHGSWKNKSKKTVKKTITIKVKCLSNKYKIYASYTTDYHGEEITYKDEDKAVSALKTSVVTSKLKWNFSKLGKGQKAWKYRYKFTPYKGGIKKYVEVFNKNGARIKTYLDETIPITKVIELIEIMKAR